MLDITQTVITWLNFTAIMIKFFNLRAHFPGGYAPGIAVDAYVISLIAFITA